jgi:hypothetical protein
MEKGEKERKKGKEIGGKDKRKREERNKEKKGNMGKKKGNPKNKKTLDRHATHTHQPISSSNCRPTSSYHG